MDRGEIREVLIFALAGAAVLVLIVLVVFFSSVIP